MSDSRDQAAELSLVDLVAFLRRHKWLLAGCLVVGLALSVAYLFIKTPLFRSTATLHLEEGGAGSLMGDLAAFATLTGGSGAGAEIGILQSRSLAEEVVRSPEGGGPPGPREPGLADHLGLTTLTRELGMTLGSVALRGYRETAAFGHSLAEPHGRLHADAERVGDSAPRAVLIEFLTEKEVEVSSLTQMTRFTRKGKDPLRLPFAEGEPFEYRGLRVRCVPEGEVVGHTFLLQHMPFADAVDRLRRMTSVEEVGRSSGILRVSVADTDPARAAESANALCNVYLLRSEAKSRRRAAQTIGSIEEMLSNQIADFEEAQTSLIQIQAKNPQLINLEASSKAAIDQIAGLEARRIQLVVQKGAFERLLTALDSGDRTALAGLDSALTTGLVVDPVTEGLLGSVAELSTEYTTMRQKLTDDAAEVVQLRTAALELEDQIGEQIRGRVTALTGQIGGLEAEVASVLSGMISGPAVQKDYLSLLSQVEAQKEVLPLLLRGIMTAEVARLSSAKSAEYLDPAIAPRDFDSPKLGPTLLVGALLGFALGACLALLVDSRGRRALVAEDFEVLEGVTLLGEVPATGRRGARADGRLDDSYRALRERLEYMHPGEGAPRTIGITSLGRDVGAPAVHLARSASRAGHRVLLVDCQGAGGGTAAALELEAELLEFQVDGDVAWDECIAKREELDLLVVGDASALGGDRWSALRFGPLLRAMAGAYERVFLALPPAGAGADVLVASRSVDDLILFCPARRTRADELGRTVSALQRVGAPLRGVVLGGAKA